MQPAKIVPLIKIGSPKGLKGKFKAHILSPDVVLREISDWYLQAHGGEQWIKIDPIEIFDCGNKHEVSLKHVTTRDDTLVHALLGAELPEDTMLSVDLSSFEVVNLEGESLGKVVDVEFIPAGYKVVYTDKGSVIPLIEKHCQNIDYDAKTILVDWPLNF